MSARSRRADSLSAYPYRSDQTPSARDIHVMARLQIGNSQGERGIEVTLSRRNLLTLLHTLDVPGSMRQIENNDCWEDGVRTPYFPHEVLASELPVTLLVLRCEDDDEHYAKRLARPGPMHPLTEVFVRDHGGASGDRREWLGRIFDGGIDADGRWWIWHSGLNTYGEGESCEAAKADLLEEVADALDE